MLEVRHLTKRFGDVKAVNDLTITVPQGQLYGLLGPNGAGKTTTIKIMTGLFTPSAGSILIGGYDVQQQPLQAKEITGYVPDQPFLYEKLTGREFLYFSAGLYRIPHSTATERIRELVDTFEIGSWLDRRTEHYSQGMRQRIVFAAALLHKPRLLVIDEPMVGLDPRGAQIVKNTLRQRADEGVAIFMSTHSLQVVEEICDRVGILREGRLVFEGSTEVFVDFRKNHDGTFESLFLEVSR